LTSPERFHRGSDSDGLNFGRTIEELGKDHPMKESKTFRDREVFTMVVTLVPGREGQGMILQR
jgi:hypothetical protein